MVFCKASVTDPEMRLDIMPVHFLCRSNIEFELIFSSAGSGEDSRQFIMRTVLHLTLKIHIVQIQHFILASSYVFSF